MRKSRPLAAPCLLVRADARRRRRAGADQPRVRARRLHDAQEHGEAAGRAQGADRRARRADCRGDAARQKRRAPPAVRERHGAAQRPTVDRGATSTRDRSCCAPIASSPIRRSRMRCGSSRSTRRRSSCSERVTAHVALRKRSDAAGAGPAAAGAADRQGSRHLRRRRARPARIAVLLRPRRARRARRHLPR